MKIISVLILLLFLQSCSLAPFSSATSGSSNGAGVPSVSFGNSNTNFFIKFQHGLSSNFDLGYVMEFGSLSTSGLFFLYSIKNNQTGHSMAVEGGYGASDSSSYNYLGLVNSLAFSDNLEVFLAVRAVSVETDEKDVTLGDTIGAAKITDYSPRYFYNTFGLNLMTSKSVGLNLYGIYIVGHGVQSPDGFGSGFGITYKL